MGREAAKKALVTLEELQRSTAHTGELVGKRNFPDPHIFERSNSEFRSQAWSKQDKNIRMSYEWIASIENLNDVPNPWKGFTMNRCLVVALAVLLVSSGVKEVQEALDYFVEETGIMSLIDCLQTGSLPQFSIWDSVTSWWGCEELGAIRRRKKPIGKKAILKPKAKE
ncbi:hypothetical protein CRENBAI_023758 [Crenichthys baileyi]|uniref:Uncharacterized protein n=1 Tax=Crenichthys baileyi TaxID=28760 RepID=A0AAV9QYV2_9TELE